MRYHHHMTKRPICPFVATATPGLGRSVKEGLPGNDTEDASSLREVGAGGALEVELFPQLANSTPRSFPWAPHRPNWSSEWDEGWLPPKGSFHTSRQVADP